MAQASLAGLGALNASFHASRIHGREFVGPLTQATVVVQWDQSRRGPLGAAAPLPRGGQDARRLAPLSGAALARLPVVILGPTEGKGGG
jgi:hypothetical protein